MPDMIRLHKQKHIKPLQNSLQMTPEKRRTKIASLEAAHHS